MTMVSDDIGYSATSIGKKKFCRTCGIGCSMVGIRTAPTPVGTSLVSQRQRGYGAPMKTFTVREAEGQLARFISGANEGEIIVLKDGDKEATLDSPRALDLEEDSPELEAELLKAVNGPHSPMREGELREIADKVVRERRTR